MAKKSSQSGWGTHLTAWWPADPTAYASPREKRGGQYEPYVPPLIAERAFELDETAALMVEEGARESAVASCGGRYPGGVDSLAETLLRSESVASSRIEGLQMTHARIARARRGSSEDKTARDALANIAAMRTAIEWGATAGHVSVDAIKSIHRALLPEDLDNEGRPIGGVLRVPELDRQERRHAGRRNVRAAATGVGGGAARRPWRLHRPHGSAADRAGRDRARAV